MSIPVATHRIDVLRTAKVSEADPWERGVLDTYPVAENVRAVISVPGGIGSSLAPDGRESVDYILLCDPCPLGYLDVVEDRETGTRYSVKWAVPSPGLAGLASVKAGLSTYQGIGQEGNGA